MELNALEHVAAPVDAVFAAACRFGRFELLARERGARVRRVEPDPEAGHGLRWEVQAPLKGRLRGFTLELVERVDRERLLFCFDGGMLHGTFVLSFRDVAPEETAVAVRLAARGKSIKGKLLLESARLAQGRIEAGLAEQLRRAARRAEVEWTQPARTAP